MSDAELRTALRLDLGLSEGDIANRTTPELLVQHQRAILHRKGIAPAWLPYNVFLTGSGSSLGNGTASGSYFAMGNICTFRCSLSLGSTTTLGSVVQLSLPGTAKTNQAAAGVGYDASAGVNLQLGGFIFALNAHAQLVCSSGHVTSAVPITWATDDQLILTGSYELL